MTRIVCLIAPAPHTIYFVNRIHQKHPVSLVVSELGTPSSVPMHRRLRRLASPRAASAAIRERLRDPEHHRAAEERIFGRAAARLDPAIEVMEVASVNEPGVAVRLAAEKPDVLIDHGTSIVKPPVLSTAAFALNLHWGLSPYYRGVRCTEWALINWDPYNIGVTIHQLTQQIDGGPIWAQERATVAPADDVHSLNMQLTRRGTDLAIRTLDALARGSAPPPQPQRREIGFLTLSRQWTPELDAQVAHIERGGLIARMLEHPARQALPIVE